MNVSSPGFEVWVKGLEKDGWERSRIESHLVGWGWHASAIDRALDAIATKDQHDAARTTGQAGYDFMKGINSRLRVRGSTTKVAMFMRRPEVVLLSDFMSREECDRLKKESVPKLKRSEVVDPGDIAGGSVLSYARTSETAFLSPKTSELVDDLQRRVSQVVGYSHEQFEDMQVSRYVPGEEFAPHHDYFDTESLSSRNADKEGNQRIATVLLYLSEPEEGGTTIFSDVEMEVVPTVGSALIFRYEAANAGTLTLHGGSPVLKGEKWVGTIFVRKGRERRSNDE